MHYIKKSDSYLKAKLHIFITNIVIVLSITLQMSFILTNKILRNKKKSVPITGTLFPSDLTDKIIYPFFPFPSILKFLTDRF